MPRIFVFSFRFWLLGSSLLILFKPLCFAWQGLSETGEPKYKDGFVSLSYANPLMAKKGGHLSLSSLVDVDTLNPYSIKGVSHWLLHSLVFSTLGQSTLDEPMTKYPRVANSFVLASDKRSMRVTLNPRATFSDGHPVTAKDILFSLEIFQSDNVAPHYNSYWRDISHAKLVGTHEVDFYFSTVNPELPLITLELPVLAKHIYGKDQFGKIGIDYAVGTGPYRVESFKAGSHITFKRNTNFWDSGSPFNFGRYNFDTITLKQFKNQTAAHEGLKKGSFDFYECLAANVWSMELRGPKFEKNWIKKEKWRHSLNQGSSGMCFNLALKQFANKNVRKAISLVFPFNWINKVIFHGQYKRSQSFFENSEYKAEGKPSQAEVAILEKLKKECDDFPSEALDEPMANLGAGLSERQRMELAAKLLKDSGYVLKDMDGKRILVGADNSHKLSFDYPVFQQGLERVIEPFAVVLRRLGIYLNIRRVPVSAYVRALNQRDFGMTNFGVAQSQRPGNEQFDFWHSENAKKPYSRNVYGLANCAVDRLVKMISYASDHESLVLVTKVLDRVLYHLHLTVHGWYLDSYRVAYWNKISFPESFPPYYSPLQLLEFAWLDEEKSRQLEIVSGSNHPLPY